MQPSEFKQPTANRRTVVGLIALLIIILGLLTWANYRFLQAPKYVHRDFMSLWGGGRALLEGHNPYDPRVWTPLRLRYGSKWLPDSQNPFPLWTLIMAIPYAVVEFGWGAAAWLTTGEVLMGLCVFLLAVSLGARLPGLAEFALVALGAYTLRGTLVTLHNGQITFVLVLVITLFLLFYRQRRFFLAGFCLCFLLLKPNPVLLLMPLLALWLLWQKKWRVIGGGLIGIGLMFAASWWMIPGWPSQWLGVSEKTIATFITPTVWGIAAELSPQWAPLIGLSLAILITTATGWFAFNNRQRDILAVVAIGVTASLMVTPYAWAYEHALLVIPLVLLFTRITPRWLAWIVWIALAFVLPWAAFRFSGSRDRATTEMVVPLLVFLAFWAFTAIGQRKKTLSTRL